MEIVFYFGVVFGWGGSLFQEISCGGIVGGILHQKDKNLNFSFFILIKDLLFGR